MKTLLLFLLISTSCLAQEWTVTKTGLVAKNDDTKNFIIREYSNIPADTLFAVAKKYIQSKYGGAINVIKSEEAGKFLNFEIADRSVSKVKRNKADVEYFVTYKGILEFKDNKAKITFSTVEPYYIDSANEKFSLPFTSYWNSDRKLVDKESKKLIETHFNTFTKQLFDTLNINNKVSSEW